MKVCFFGKELSMISGHSQMAFLLAEEVQKQAGSSAIIITNDASPEYVRRHKFKLAKESLGGVRTIKPFRSLNEFLVPQRRLKMALLHELKGVDILHAFDFKSLFLLKRLLGQDFPFPTVCTFAGLPKLNLSDFKAIGLPGLLRVVTTPNYLLSLVTPEAVLRKALEIPDRIIVTSQFLADFLLGIGVKKERISTVFPHINTKNFESRSRYSFRGFPCYLYFGWISDIRGSLDVLVAFKKVYEKNSKAKLVFPCLNATDLETRFILSKIKKQLSSRAIILRGYEKNVPKLLASVDVVVLPFRLGFGFTQPPMVLLESMAAGKPVITTKIGSSDIVKDSKNGLLVPPGNVEALFQKMLLVKTEPARMRRIGIKARKTIEKKFSREKSITRVLEIYKEVINEWDKQKIVSGWHKYSAQKGYSLRKTGINYDKERFTSYGGRLFDHIEKQIVLNSAPENKEIEILEAGTGTGRFAIALAQKGYRVTAIDVSGPLMKKAEQKIDNLGLSSKIKLEKADIYKLPYKDDSFDFVYAIRVINQIWNNFHKREAISELSRVVKPGGVLLFDVVNKNSLAYFKAPKILISINEIKEILEELGFRKIEVIGRLTLSQTLLEKLPPFLALWLSRFDTFFSELFPFFATRVYFKCENRV